MCTAKDSQPIFPSVDDGIIFNQRVFYPRTGYILIKGDTIPCTRDVIACNGVAV